MELSVEPEISTTGTFNLRCQESDQTRYELEQRSRTLGTSTVYQGSDTARVMTGLPNGDYTHRVRAMLVFIVVFAALASSLDSLLAAASDLIFTDLYKGHLRPDASDEELARAARWVIDLRNGRLW